MWIGEIQWMRRNGFNESRDPILKPLETIECRDAILTPEGGEPEWPAADVVIGNPPFLGGKLLNTHLGEDYVGIVDWMQFGNVLARAERHKRVSGAQVVAHLELLGCLPIVTDAETQPRAFREILMLARTQRLTTYDAAYLELAMRRGIALATRGKALVQAARHLDVETLSVQGRTAE